MKVLKILTNSAILALGMRTTMLHPKDKMELRDGFVLVNDTVIVPIHRINEMVVEKEVVDATKSKPKG
jgi:hypothetical protein